MQSAHSTRKAFRGPKKDVFSKVDERIALFVRTKHDEGKPITQEKMVMTSIEVAAQLDVPRVGFKTRYWMVQTNDEKA
ncbi:hypothetical protein PR048_014377 [Dryococelus australis]|uniref:Uncharacterized protein n=1 Tax=Dryococelus australis TaxID=614101 RepID=A0ABQ9HE27_9NEOP|nr:hypothetical protein PR048_014377 [Dryococelus australis]